MGSVMPTMPPLEAEYLPVFGGDRAGVDEDAALTVFGHGFEGQHAGCRLRDAAEGADEIDLNEAVEMFDRVRRDFGRVFLAACRLDREAGAGAVDENAFLAEDGAGLLETVDDALLAGHVDFAVDAVDVGGDLFALGFVAVEDSDADAGGCEFAGGSFAEARGAAGDDGRDGAIELHDGSLFAKVGKCWGTS
jgi:hypothetical protein